VSNPAQDLIDRMIEEATADITVMGSSAVVINGIDALVAAAVAKALDNGATETQLAPFADLTAALAAKRTELVTAIAARTAAQTELGTASEDAGKTARKKS